MARKPDKKHYVFCVRILSLYAYNILDTLPFALFKKHVAKLKLSK